MEIPLGRLNYQHLYYFWSVAKAGSIKKACESLGLAQPTISGQIALFEKAIGTKVFRRESRKLILTESGWLIFNFADEIFSIGDDLTNWLKGSSMERRRTLKIGVCNSVDMLVIQQLLSPALDEPEPPQLVCFGNDAERLLLELRLRSYDVAILSAPAPLDNGATFSHLLAVHEISLFAPARTATAYRKDFPRSVRRAPMVLPIWNSALRQSLERWFQMRSIEPEVKAEIGVRELAKSVAVSCGGLVFAPTATQDEMRQRYGLEPIGVAQGVEERVYAATNQRKIRNPAVARILGVDAL